MNETRVPVDPEMRIPLILLTGGTDSSLLLWRQLKKGPCDVLYAFGGQIESKAVMEIEAVKKVIDYCERELPYRVRNRYTVGQVKEIDYMNLTWPADTMYLEAHPSSGVYGSRPIGDDLLKPMMRRGRAEVTSQPISWIMACFRRVCPEIHSEIQMGYLMDDSIRGAIATMARIWDGLYELYFLDDSIPATKLVFPLKNKLKIQIVEEYRSEQITDMFNLTWSCELPMFMPNETDPDRGDAAPCGCCGPCRNRAVSLEPHRGPNIHAALGAVDLIRRSKFAEHESRESE